MPLPDEGNRDMVLPPLMYAFVQTENSGAIRTLVGPAAAPISGQDRPVRFDPDTRAFRRCSQEDAVCQFVHAGEGEYIILENPAKDQPNTGSHNTPETGLQMGSQVVIHGPRSFALWPGQSAKTIGAHHMKFNQFVLVRVYNEAEARRNWPDGAGIKAEDLRLGQLYIIRGDQRSFYMPVTGIEVVPDENGQYVRDAVTLEQLEYCKLVDENGTMRYERGPNVVFPRPTERFVHEGQSRISRARELTPLTGLHIKVIRDYTEGDRQYKVGRVRNNKVSDIVELETADHVRVSVKLSMMVNFEGEDANRWFQVENYVKLLCDHVRSVFKGVVQRIKIEDFYSNYVPTIRDAILGASKETGRDGMTFAENGMRVKDVEVLGFEIRDEQVRLFLTNAQFNVVKSSIDTEEAERKAALATKAEEFKRQMKVAVTDTERAALVLEAALHAERHKNALAVLEANLAEAKQKLEVETATAEAEFVEHEWDLKRRREIATHEDNLEKAKLALRVQLIQQETAATVERFNAAKGEVATAINTLADKDLAARIAELIGPMHNISGKGFAESLTQIFANLPIAGFVEKLTRGDRSLPSA